MMSGLNIDDDADMEFIDGWDELDEVSREKLREAIKVGHVPDEDWKGVSEVCSRLTEIFANP